MQNERLVTPPRISRNAFTLIELLVVIAIIALLVGILLPSLGAARNSAKNLKCKINMRSIDLAMNLYRDDNRGWANPDKNYGARFDLNGARYDADDQYAYWGVFYDSYINDAFEVWQCPDFQLMDPYPFWGTDLDFIYETQRYQTYGMNAYQPDRNSEDARFALWKDVRTYITGRGGIQVAEYKPYMRPLSQLRRPNDMIVFQDAFEHAMETGNDALDGLSQYDSNYGGLENYWKDAYFRHEDKCNVMFADGHLESYDRQTVTDEGDPNLRYNYTGNPDDLMDNDTNP